MKKTIAVLLTVLMTLSLLAACGKPADKNVEKADLIGTWRGKGNMSAYMRQIEQYLPGASAYFTDYTIDLILTFKDETLIGFEADVEPAAADLRARLKRYVADHPETVEGIDEDEAINGVVDKFVSGFKGLETAYTLDGNKLTIGQMKGTVTGSTIKVNHPNLGEIIFNKQ